MSFEKFTDKARKVLVLAQDERADASPALRGHRAYPCSASSRKKDGMAAQALDRLNVRYDGVVQAIRQVVTIDEDTDVSGHLSFTPRVKRVLENSLREAMQMGQSYISTEHLLLGLVREGDDTAMEVLGRLNVTGTPCAGAEFCVVQSPSTPGRAGLRRRRGARFHAHEFGTDLTAKAREGKRGSSAAPGNRARHADFAPPEEQPAHHGEKTAIAEGQPGARHPAGQAPGHAGRLGLVAGSGSTAASSRSA